MPQRLAQYAYRHLDHANHTPDLPSKRSALAPPPHSLKRALVAHSQSIKPIHTHHLHIGRIPRQIKPHHNDKIGKHQYTALEVIALPLAVHVAQQEHAEDDGHHVPLRENEAEGVIEQGLGTDVLPVYGAEKHQCRDLQETDLQGVGGADLHREGDVAVHGEGNGVEELGCVWDQGEESDAQEFLVNVDAFQDHVDGVYEDLGDYGVEHRCSHEDDRTLQPAPIGSIVAATRRTFDCCCFVIV